jgi:hypothetical protein
MYRQDFDLYETSMNYNTQSGETIIFFKIVQAKLHYASSGHTARDVVFDGANAELPYMSLTVFKANRLQKVKPLLRKTI